MDENLFVGLTVQAIDHLQRDDSSFNARNTGLAGLTSSRERTGIRAHVGARYRFTRRTSYLSLGLVLNEDDVEIMEFDRRVRAIGDSAFTEIAMALFSSAPDLLIRVSGDAPLAPEDRDALVGQMTGAYKGNLHNRYHIFGLGMGYRFE